MTLRRATAALALLAASSLAALAADPTPAPEVVGPTYDTAEAAVTALIDAVRSNKPDAIMAALGPGSDKLVNSGDPAIDATNRHNFAAAYDQRHALVGAGSGRLRLVIGDDDWSYPIPLHDSDGRWHFDTMAGAQELIDRRVGRDELAAIRASLAYVDAQKAFFEMARQVEGTPFYAQRLVSSTGKHDGLYWERKEGEAKSPLALLVARAPDRGPPGAQAAGRPQPYFGYYFRILTGQGPNSPGGTKSYLGPDGEITKGFALIAWPASYGASGVMSFIVNQDGIVFQKDLGPKTPKIAKATAVFDPDLSWMRVDVVD